MSDSEAREGMNARLGRCYELSGRYVALEGRERCLTLVHGSIEGGGFPRNPHAWVEYLERIAGTDITFVFDPVTEYRMPKEVYALTHGIMEYARYDQDETRKQLLKTETFGPWDLESERARIERERHAC